MAALSWREVRVFLEETDAALIAELTGVRSRLDTAQAGGDWTPAQVVDHLVRTEKLLYLIFTLIPKLRRFPRILRAADKADAWLWRTLGLRTVESPGAKLTPANATEGRFIAPLFLRPPQRARDFDELIASRRRTRERTYRTVSALDEQMMNRLTWSHPLLATYTLMEFVQFLGTHELHHLPQIRRIRESEFASGNRRRIETT